MVVLNKVTAHPVRQASTGPNCGIGSEGFKQGNTCAKGGKGGGGGGGDSGEAGSVQQHEADVLKTAQQHLSSDHPAPFSGAGPQVAEEARSLLGNLAHHGVKVSAKVVGAVAGAAWSGLKSLIAENGPVGGLAMFTVGAAIGAAQPLAGLAGASLAGSGTAAVIPASAASGLGVIGGSGAAAATTAAGATAAAGGVALSSVLLPAAAVGLGALVTAGAVRKLLKLIDHSQGGGGMAPRTPGHRSLLDKVTNNQDGQQQQPQPQPTTQPGKAKKGETDADLNRMAQRTYDFAKSLIAAAGGTLPRDVSIQQIKAKLQEMLQGNDKEQTTSNSFGDRGWVTVCQMA